MQTRSAVTIIWTFFEWAPGRLFKLSEKPGVALIVLSGGNKQLIKMLEDYISIRKGDLYINTWCLLGIIKHNATITEF